MIAQTGLLENMAPHGGFMPAYKIQMLSLSLLTIFFGQIYKVMFTKINWAKNFDFHLKKQIDMYGRGIFYTFYKFSILILIPMKNCC